jgi:hypothetical protein
MPNPFKAKPGSKKLNEPTSTCPNNKAEIDVEVYGVDPRNVEPQAPVEGVEITVTGPTATSPAKTPANGKWRYQPLTPGNYSASLNFPPDLDERYDLSTLAAILKNVAAGGVETAVFLVPWVWVEFIAMDTAQQTLPNLDWMLERKKGGGAFNKYDTGTTAADGKVYRKHILTGTHQFTDKDLRLPAWSAAEAVIGREMTLSARTDGFAAGDAGTFEILDAYNVATILEIVNAKVKNTNGTLQLEAKWKPKEATFANLKHCNIAFRAKAGNAVAYSATQPLLKPDTVMFTDKGGANVDRQIDLLFSGGTQRSVTTAGGKVDFNAPWAETLISVRFPGLTSATVKVDPGSNPGAVGIV